MKGKLVFNRNNQAPNRNSMAAMFSGIDQVTPAQVWVCSAGDPFFCVLVPFGLLYFVYKNFFQSPPLVLSGFAAKLRPNEINSTLKVCANYTPSQNL